MFLSGFKNSLLRRLGARIISPITAMRFNSNSSVAGSVIELMNKNKKNTNLLGLDFVLRNESKKLIPIFKKDHRSALQDFRSQAQMMPGRRSKNALVVDVRLPASVANDYRAFQQMVSRNRIAMTQREQQFYIRPGRKRRLAKSKKHRKEFMAGFKHLIGLVKDAKRKGY